MSSTDSIKARRLFVVSRKINSNKYIVYKNERMCMHVRVHVLDK